VGGVHAVGSEKHYAGRKVIGRLFHVAYEDGIELLEWVFFIRSSLFWEFGGCCC